MTSYDNDQDPLGLTPTWGTSSENDETIPTWPTTRAGTVGEVIDQRIALYGDPAETFDRIAEVWSGILGHPVQGHEVPLLLIGMKLVRTQVTPDYSDNSDDIEGYLDIFRTVMGDDMIHARLSSEYWEKKGQR